MSEQWDGRPQNPEQSGMHLLRSRLTGHLTGWYWNAATERFHHEHVTLGRAASIERYVYECPIVTPAEVEAARREEREANAAWHDERARLERQSGSVTGARAEEYAAAAIRARGDA
jgi:hypothetical protein